jgi:hypothetical protein
MGRWFSATLPIVSRNNCTNARRPRRGELFPPEFVPPHSVSVLHIYFPDPWPKARHHKRRLIQPRLLPLVERILKPDGGRIRIVTDHKGYWEENIEPTIRGATFLHIDDYARPGSAGAGEIVGGRSGAKVRAKADVLRDRRGRPTLLVTGVYPTDPSRHDPCSSSLLHDNR